MWDYDQGMTGPEQGSSPLAEALARVGDRWTLLVVEALLAGPLRFNDLLGQIQGKTVYQRAVSAQENFDKIMLRVNNWILDGIRKGATSSIITLG